MMQNHGNLSSRLKHRNEFLIFSLRLEKTLIYDLGFVIEKVLMFVYVIKFLFKF